MVVKVCCVMYKYVRAGLRWKPCHYVLTLLWVVFSFTVPLSFVGYILQGVQLRDDYVFHANLPSREVAKPIDFHDNRLQQQNWSDFLFAERKGWFQNITNEGLAIVFSAYLDDMKNSKKIRAIGAKKRDYGLNISCLVFYSVSDTDGGAEKIVPVTVSGYISEHMEIFERSWAPVHYMCNLEDLPPNPYAVAIVAKGDTKIPLNRVFVKYTAEDSFKTYTVCLHNAFNFRTDVSTEIVEWVEVNRVLGADHFMVYNYSSHPRNDLVLKWYEKQGLITIVPWDLPIFADLIFIGEVVVMQDCLYRNFYRSKFISHLDLDEYIVPRRPGVTTVPELVAALPSRCGYIVRCAVFPVADGSNGDAFEGKETAEKYKLNTLLVGQRLQKIWKSKDRSKQLLRTACIELAGVHQVDGYTSLISEMTYEPSDALLHHYRRGRPRFVKSSNKTEDGFMLRYASKLIENVEFAWTMIEKSNNSAPAA